MVAEDVVLKAAAQAPGLDGQAVDHVLSRRVAGLEPFHPVHDAQRRRVGLPAVPVTGRVLGDPALDELPVAGVPLNSAPGVEVVEVVQVIEPELVIALIVPDAGIIDPRALVQEARRVRIKQALLAGQGRYPWPSGVAHGRGRLAWDPRAVEPVPETPPDLPGAQVPNRVEVELSTL